jgi:hypothetical protein
LLDFSDGSNGPPYDQNDWVKLYLPTFQVNSECVEDPTATPPGYELCNLDFDAVERLEFGFEDYEYSNDLTAQFEEDMGRWSPTKPQSVNWRVYKRASDSEDYPSNRDVRVYAVPEDIPYADYVLIYEGCLNSDGEIQLA